MKLIRVAIRSPSIYMRELSRRESQLWVFVVSGTLLCLNFWILSLPDFLRRVGSDTMSAYLLGTGVLLAINIALLLVATDRNGGGWSSPHEIGQPWLAMTVGLCGLTVLVIGCYRWLRHIFAIPIDPMRADMLVVIREGIRTLLQGGDPYRLYNVPWEAALPYGPVLWVPYILPYALKMDLRFLPVAAALFIAALCGVAATVLGYRRQWLGALVLLALELTVCLNLKLYHFIVIAHTPVYWPLIFLFCYLFSQGRSGPAAVTLGLLLAARATMTALVPIFFIYAIKGEVEDRRLSLEGQGHKPGLIRLFVYFCTAAVTPFLPFAIWNFRSLWYSIYGNYFHLVKGFVWQSTDWVGRTFGTTGYLLSRGWQDHVEHLQIGVMLSFYVLAWLRITHRAQALRWMGMALLLFSMTSLWPVYYLYLDVFVLLVVTFVIEPPMLGNWLPRVRLVPFLTGMAFTVLAVLFAVARSLAGNY